MTIADLIVYVLPSFGSGALGAVAFFATFGSKYIESLIDGKKQNALEHVRAELAKELESVRASKQQELEAFRQQSTRELEHLRSEFQNSHLKNAVIIAEQRKSFQNTLEAFFKATTAIKESYHSSPDAYLVLPNSVIRDWENALSKESLFFSRDASFVIAIATEYLRDMAHDEPDGLKQNAVGEDCQDSLEFLGSRLVLHFQGAMGFPTGKDALIHGMMLGAMRLVARAVEGDQPFSSIFTYDFRSSAPDKVAQVQRNIPGMIQELKRLQVHLQSHPPRLAARKDDAAYAEYIAMRLSGQHCCDEDLKL